LHAHAQGLSMVKNYKFLLVTHIVVFGVTAPIFAAQEKQEQGKRITFEDRLVRLEIIAWGRKEPDG